ncbi:serine/threonine protein phosphatase [Hymenobacter lapidiphilus]|uniref:metallophosphoesterase family protein n=1 Tax=Hymenobacter sp. CCM 8763 TaxID=2303334 RepID=UPI000E34C8E5|nr:metallophosphoesterase family protein [Hymenobacter sp. CCM 8763]RFP64900.1 serine/threonine protein phosphatase [Hymenobacter sp. CCM 8763]
MARYALTDIHGCLLTLRALLARLPLRPADELYFLGDYVNKGPDSRGVLDYLMALPGQGYQVVCLRGNHDQELLDAAEGRTDQAWLGTTERALTLRSFGITSLQELPLPYLRWLRELPYQLDIAGWTLVHAGYDFRQPAAAMRRDWRTMLNTKAFVFDASRLQGRRLVHGHVPTPYAEVQRRLAHHPGAVCLDTGCVYRHNPELRHLAAFNLDTHKLTLQPNIEPEYPIAKR